MISASKGSDSLKEQAGSIISHLKQHFRMGKCYLKGESGDQINVILAAAAYNLRKMDPIEVGSRTVFKESQFLYLSAS